MRTFLRLPTRRAAATATALWALAGWAAATGPGGIANSPLELTRTYHGADGSTFATRMVGDVVVGYSEDASGQRAFVFKGTRSGMTISGTYYGVPAGASTATGPLVLTYADGGSSLTRTGGHDVGTSYWLAKLPSQFSYPQERPAQFQSTSMLDLDGAYRGNDGSRAYVRQYGSTVVYVAERFGNPAATRPTYASVYIAERSGNTLSGTYYDLPKQTAALRFGTVTAQVTGRPRAFAQTAIGGGQVAFATYTADYAVDPDRFAQEISDRLTPFTVGFGYAIARDGTLLRSGAGGARRAVTATNGLGSPWPFTQYTVNEVASTAKTVTLVAVLKALREKGISVDAPVGPYLPAAWPRGPGMDTVTFRQLLSHGLRPSAGVVLLPSAGVGLAKPGVCANDPRYACLQGAVAAGMTVQAGYDNIHYAIFRVILPFVIDPAGMAAAFAASNDPEVLNQAYSAVFRTAIRNLLTQAGVTADFAYPASTPLAYRYAWGTPPTAELAPVGSEADYLEAGSGGLKMSAREFALFLSRLQRGDLLGAADLATAQDIGFGGTGPMTGPGDVGPIWGKNGGAGGAASQAMVFPGVEVFVTRNSTGNAAQTADSTMLMQAWQASLRGN